MFMKKYVTGFIVLLIMMVVVNAVGSLGVVAESGEVTQPTEKEQLIEVELLDDVFKPDVITIPNGTTTTIILKNKGQKEHTFRVEDLGIDAEVQPGEEKNITVKPSQPGTYELICRYHFREGMVGKVIVE